MVSQITQNKGQSLWFGLLSHQTYSYSLLLTLFSSLPRSLSSTTGSASELVTLFVPSGWMFFHQILHSALAYSLDHFFKCHPLNECFPNQLAHQMPVFLALFFLALITIWWNIFFTCILIVYLPIASGGRNFWLLWLITNISLIPEIVPPHTYHSKNTCWIMNIPFW